MIVRDAQFSEDRKHRLSLSRIWNESKELVLYVGLNPSTADKTEDDMTVRKGIGFAQRWGFGGTLHGNAFTVISSTPNILLQPEGTQHPDGERALFRMAERARLVVFMWGAFPDFAWRFAQVEKLLERFSPKCLGRTAEGFPRHISRIAYSTPLVDWKQAVSA